MKLWKHSGILLIGTGILHNALGFIFGWPQLVEIFSHSIWDSMSVTGDRRQELLWFLMLGFAWIMAGALMHTSIKENNIPVSKTYGWVLLLKGVSVAILMPASGAWLIIPQGIILLSAKRESTEYQSSQR